MADNVNVPISGTGDTGPVNVATDDCGSGGHVGLGKLAISADGDRTLIPADATNGLDVDVTRVIPGTSATHLGKAEDAVHSSGDVGVMMLAIRKDTAAAVAADGDYVPLQTDANGRLVVLEQYSPDIKAFLDTITNTGHPITGTVTVGSHAVTNAGTFAVQVSSALPAGNNNIGDVDVATVPADPFGANADAASATGSISAKLRFIAGTGIPITGTVTVGSHAVTNAGTFAVQAAQSGTWTVTGAGGTFPVTDSGGSLTVDNGGTFAVQAACAGDVAHDSADSGNPVKVGGRAMTTARTAVADGDRADLAVDVQGRVITEPYGPRELDVMQATVITSSTAETTVVTAVASTFLDIIDVIVCNKSASATLVTFKDSTSGTTRFYLYVPAGATVGFSGQRWPQATVNNNWTATCGTSVDSVYISIRARKTK